MIRSLKINGYRGFSEFTADGLARLNLIVGKNNAGKTALLEAAAFAASGADPMVLAKAAARRGEVLPASLGRLPPGTLPPGTLPALQPLVSFSALLADMVHVFHGHQIRPDATIRIAMQPIGGNVAQECVLRVEAAGPRQGDGGALELRGADPRSELKIVSSVEKPRAFFPYQFVLHQGRGIEVEERSDELVQFLRTALTPGDMFEPVPPIVIPAEALSPADLAKLWTQVQVLGREDEVIQALRVIESELSAIVFLATPLHPSAAGAAGILVQTRPDSPRVPLGSFGEGMRRMLTMATAIVVAQGGTFTIDEIDTGLHYSVLSRVWELVLTAAIAHDVQVFATTHSADCVRGLEMLCLSRPELQEHVALHKIVADLPKTLCLGGDKLALAFDGDLEVR